MSNKNTLQFQAAMQYCEYMHYTGKYKNPEKLACNAVWSTEPAGWRVIMLNTRETDDAVSSFTPNWCKAAWHCSALKKYVKYSWKQMSRTTVLALL